MTFESVVKQCVILLILIISGSGTSLAQGADPSESPQIGTLNLLLANRDGFVIAADSRRTQLSDGRHWDDSQKLFRVGPSSALAIAGFASWAAQGSPLDVQVASLLREEFSDRVWTSGKRPITALPNMIKVNVGYELELFGAISATNRPSPPPEQLDFQVLAAGLAGGKVQIVRIHFKPRVELFGPFDLATPFYDMQSTSSTAESFVALSGGIDGIARGILDGSIDTSDERILSYYRARSTGQLDDLSLDSIQHLAEAILESTERASEFVGGPNQIGVFPKKGPIKWILPTLATEHTRLRSTFLHEGFTYTHGGLMTPLEYSRAHGKRMVARFGVSLLQPFDEPFTQVFVSNWFRDVPVSLDGNAFAGNYFRNVTFKYQGGSFYFAANTLAGCKLEVPLGTSIPPFLRVCKVKVEESVDLRDSFGAPMKASPKGCVTRNRDGRLLIRTRGRQNGKDCTGSGVQILFRP